MPTPAKVPSPAEAKGAAEPTKPAQKIPDFIPKGSQPNAAALNDKRRRVAELAKLPAIETASALAE
ncbi:MAG TPA: hypothetical protein VGD78_20905, partial [Chthoniobacterales bacterium]